MGLDGVELIMELEERFGIELPDDELEGTLTIADLHRLIAGKLAHREAWPCLTSVLFLRTRKALVDLTGADRRDISPRTDTAGLLPTQDRRATWDALGRALELKLPPLERPLWMHRLLLASTAALIGAGILVLFLKAFAAGGALVAIGITYGAVASWATARFAVHLPEGCDTIGGAVKVALALNYGRLAAQKGRWHRGEVGEALRATIAQWLSVPPDQIRETTVLSDLVARAEGVAIGRGRIA
jgi:hypothetical protein